MRCSIVIFPTRFISAHKAASALALRRSLGNTVSCSSFMGFALTGKRSTIGLLRQKAKPDNPRHPYGPLPPLASASVLCQCFSIMVSETNDLDQAPAPPELIARAEALVREYDVQCFWFWRPEVAIRTVEDIHVVIKELRRNGGHRAWSAAQELQRCL